VHTTASVDDHFQKSLGNVWSKLKPNKAGFSHVADPLSNGRDLRSISAGLNVAGLPPYPMCLTSMHGTAPDSRSLTSLSYSVRPLMNVAGSRTIKSGGTIYPELKSDTSPPSVPSTSGHSELRCDVAKRHPAFSESRPQPPAYDIVARTQNDPQEPTIRHSSSSPNEKGKKTNFPQNSSPRPNSSQSSSDRLSVPALETTHPVVTVPPPSKSAHTITNGFSKSPAKPLPPAYSPPSSTSAASFSGVTSSPAHAIAVDRQQVGGEDNSKCVSAMSVQS